MSFLFGAPKKSIKEQAREWTSELNKQKRTLERESQRIEREEAKIKSSLKAAAKKNQIAACKTLAKSLVRSARTRENLLEGATRINSIVMSIKQNVATESVMGVMSKSTDIMTHMSKLVNLKEISEVTKSMAKEMAKSGLIGDMIEEAISSVDDESLESEADEQVDKILFEITEGQLGALPNLKQREKQKETVTNNNNTVTDKVSSKDEIESIPFA